MIPRTGYSRLQIFLHWTVALLFLCQFLFSDAMNQAARAVRHGTEPVVDAMVWQHILFGVLVLGFALWRLSLRREGGAPQAEVDVDRHAALVRRHDRRRPRRPARRV